ncbi:hypothetical protein [Corynebacterium sp.]|uniref:hypothetical protein n=1 Tax=Corynebacterium sp. TaxID=1720 RepID=UPI0028AE7D6F|nr:hypothetical protein [Corynebacterium sp.]
MKRFTTAAVAAITALSLSSTTALAARDTDKLSSTDPEDRNDSLIAAVSDSSIDPQNEDDHSRPHWNSNAAALSSYTDGETEAEPSEISSEAWDGFFGSSYDADESLGWAHGFTADVLAAGLIALGIAAFNGFIPGIEAPSIQSL